MANDLGLNGIDFIEFVSPHPQSLDRLFKDFGFSRLAHHRKLLVDYYTQNDIHFFVNQHSLSFASRFAKQHGPSISSMGWRVKNAAKAFQLAVERGAQPAQEGIGDYPLPAIYGIGDSLIYFVETADNADSDIGFELYQKWGFQQLDQPDIIANQGFLSIDHLTNNVHKGSMQQWSDFYKNVFGFEEVRYFDIRGVKTGLTSYALRSPCGKFCIPINEATEKKSQINEFLEEYNGPGVQHIAFLTKDILSSLDQLKKTSNIQTLDIDDEYYSDLFQRFPNVTENPEKIRMHNVLIDGDENGYLLQIFTKNVVGPIFIELIQRKNNYSFGEGNFGALFRSIERDQMRRGYLEHEAEN